MIHLQKKKGTLLTGKHTAPSVSPWAFLLLGFHQDWRYGRNIQT